MLDAPGRMPAKSPKNRAVTPMELEDGDKRKGEGARQVISLSGQISSDTRLRREAS